MGAHWFDAFSIPTQVQDIAADAAASSVSEPMFTLLEDDRLIARVSVDTDRLLSPPAPDYVRLVSCA
jgi:hypothetical protein